jgi:hypothetical protein
VTGPLADLREEAQRVLAEVARRGIAAGAVGGLGVYVRCPSARRPPLARDYNDLDLAAERGAAVDLAAALSDLGYAADEEFNALHGHRRMYFQDPVNHRQLDVFVGVMELCHTLDLGGRLRAGEPTPPLADLLLAKLQVVEVNEKDLRDAAAILADHEPGGGELEVERVASVLAGDWGWWRTATETLDKVAAYAASLDGFAAGDLVRERAARVRAGVDAEPKSRRWRVRAKLGERKRWYELPEEVAG